MRLLVLALLLTPATAFAHAHLVSATPEAGATIQTAPTEITIHYTEGVEPAFSAIEVQDSTGTRVDRADTHAAPTDNKTLLVGLKPLPPGTYTVTWHVTAVDTHKTQGNFSFTLRP